MHKSWVWRRKPHRLILGAVLQTHGTFSVYDAAPAAAIESAQMIDIEEIHSMVNAHKAALNPQLGSTNNLVVVMDSRREQYS